MVSLSNISLAQFQQNDKHYNNVVNFTAVPLDSSKDTTQKPNPKKSLYYLLLGGLSPAAGIVLSKQMTKLMKTDKELGISREDVEKVFSSMVKENGFVDDKKLKLFTAKSGTKEHDFLIKNAGGGYYAPSVHQIDVAEDRMSLILHETGHAINVKCTKLGNLWSKFLEISTKILPNFLKSPIGIASTLSGILLFVGLFGKAANDAKKAANKDKQTNSFSISTFIYNNIGKLTLLLFSPILIDEASATIRALKAAKKEAPQIVKPFGRNMAFAYSTYLISTIGVLASVMAFRAFSEESKKNVDYINKHPDFLKSKNELTPTPPPHEA